MLFDGSIGFTLLLLSPMTAFSSLGLSCFRYFIHVFIYLLKISKNFMVRATLL